MNAKENKILHQLAKYYGIETIYKNGFKHRVTVQDDIILYLLKSFGLPLHTMTDSIDLIKQYKLNKQLQKIEPIIISWNGINTAIIFNLNKNERNEVVSCYLIFENGNKKEWKIDLSTLPETKHKHFPSLLQKTYVFDESFAFGYHHLTIKIKNELHESTIISSPFHAFDSKSCSLYGLFVPVYALHSKRSWGCGDLTDFKQFINWATDLGCGVVSTLPLYAQSFDNHFDPSPYSAVSKLFWNELYLDITTLPEFNAARPQICDELNKTKCVNYKEVIKIKNEYLTDMLKVFFKDKLDETFETYLKTHPFLKKYADFRANLAFTNKTDMWKYHVYTQWHMSKQMHEVKEHAKHKNILLYFDMPLSVSREGFDVNEFELEFVKGVSIGSPTDPVFTQGQNWNLAPMHPVNIRKTGYHYFRKCLTTIMPYIDILRIDHVMGLHRLFWIPDKSYPELGSYVHYPVDELYAILCLESYRHRVLLVGENLGNVPQYIHEKMREHNFYSMHVMQYELDSNQRFEKNHIPETSIASLNTHDMFPFASYFQKMDIKERLKWHLLDNDLALKEESKRNKNLSIVNKTLQREHLLTKNGKDLFYILKACLLLLAKSRAAIFLINVEDLWLENQSQNIPTISEVSWKNKIKYSLEELPTLKKVNQMVLDFSSTRSVRKQAVPNFGITKEDIYLFNEGTHFRLYKKLGAHYTKHKGKEGVYFAVWAPNAKHVSVIGDFNQWRKNIHPLSPLYSSGIWTGFIPDLKKGELYKYFIHSHHHNYQVEKTDPFGIYHEKSPKTASIIWDLDYEWHDQEWMKTRHQHQNHTAPMSIYEVHLGSWKRVPEENFRFLTYREMAPLLAEYVKELGYTHVEFLPIMEFPFDGSWGYQTTGYFAPTSRFGTPQDFMYLIDYLHQNHIGVILDWVPSHFPNDQHGLNYFDGTHLFEHADPKQGFHPDWKSSIFNYGRNEIRAFLISSAFFWLDKYHIDGLRLDAVASMLYLDYSRTEGEWIPNRYGGRENLEAIYFLRRFNEEVYKHFPDIQTIAEESTAWGGVSRPTYAHGLGFGFKWDMGWMHDTLLYFSRDPIYRRHHYNEITFRMIYAFTENFILPLSHDEVVHGKASLLGKMPGSDWDKFANVRLLLGYMYAQPGKKLLFMGNDFGQWNEWNHDHSLDWHLTNYAPHKGIQRWVKKLNELYKNEIAFHQNDCNPSGFEWIDCHDEDRGVLIFIRKADNECIVVIVNTTPMVWEKYRIGLPLSGNWYELANSDESQYGGSDKHNKPFVQTEVIDFHNRKNSALFTLPPLGIIFYKWKEF